MWAGRFRLRDLRAVWGWPLHVPGGVCRGLSHHKDGCSMYRSGCWCVGGLIVGVVVATPGGVCGRLPVRARSCWVRGGGLAVWFFPIVSAGRCPVPSCKRKSLSGLIVGRAFVLSGGLIVWGCGCCTASSVGGWVSDLGCVGVCCVCPGCRRAV